MLEREEHASARKRLPHSFTIRGRSTRQAHVRVSLRAWQELEGKGNRGNQARDWAQGQRARGWGRSLFARIPLSFLLLAPAMQATFACSPSIACNSASARGLDIDPRPSPTPPPPSFFSSPPLRLLWFAPLAPSFRAPLALAERK